MFDFLFVLELRSHNVQQNSFYHKFELETLYKTET